MRPAYFVLLLAACSNGEPAPLAPERVTLTGVELRREKAAELTCFPELPPGAEAALLAIRTAAEAGDLQALRGWLAEGVSFGDPEILRELVATLDRGCLEDDSGKRVVCPPEYRHDPKHPGWRAGIERQPQGWRLVFFNMKD
ncbi:MAG TPA: hypothetical protein VNM67_24285 [Thermoanaerobaculia bacterium]|jgi:hypothetical protein|nr:hypothetical protein [Thermoanaerobaculia bacterium]